jgi:hypothetical protein
VGRPACEPDNIYSSQRAAGATWPANKKITDNTAALKDFPDVAIDAANTAYAVWQRAGRD